MVKDSFGRASAAAGWQIRRCCSTRKTGSDQAQQQTTQISLFFSPAAARCIQKLTLKAITCGGGRSTLFCRLLRHLLSRVELDCRFGVAASPSKKFFPSLNWVSSSNSSSLLVPPRYYYMTSAANNVQGSQILAEQLFLAKEQSQRHLNIDIL